MAQSITDIQKKSDEKRGMKVKGVKLHIDTIALLESLSKQADLPQSAIITEALQLYAEHLKK